MLTGKVTILMTASGKLHRSGCRVRAGGLRPAAAGRLAGA